MTKQTQPLRDQVIVLRETSKFVDRLDRLTESLGKTRSDVIRMAVAMLDHEIHADLEGISEKDRLVEHHVNRALSILMKKARMKVMAEEQHDIFRSKQNGT